MSMLYHQFHDIFNRSPGFNAHDINTWNHYFLNNGFGQINHTMDHIPGRFFKFVILEGYIR